MSDKIDSDIQVLHDLDMANAEIARLKEESKRWENFFRDQVAYIEILEPERDALTEENAALKEEMNGIMKELVAAAPPYYRKWQAAMEEYAALRSRVELLEEMIARSAPVTWASADWLDEAMQWERDAAELIGIGKEGT